MCENDVLHIYESVSGDTGTDDIIIDSIINNLSRDDYLKLKRELISLELDVGVPFPVSDSLWQQIMISYEEGLLENILLFERLKNKISIVGPERVYVDVTEDAYRHVIYDLEENSDCEFIYSNRRNQSLMPKIPFGLREILSFFISIIDQLALIFARSVTNTEKQTHTFESIVFPYPGRDESLRPVIDEMSTNTLIVVDPRSTVPNLRGYEYPHDWEGYETRSFNSFATINIILTQVQLFTLLLIEAMITKSLEKELVGTINEKRNIDVSHTVELTVQNAFKNNLLDFKRAIISRHILNQIDDVEHVITGSNGSMYRPIRHFARAAGIQNYYIPHTIVHPIEREYPPHPETNMIVAGEFDKEILENNFPSSMLPTLLPFGRPYFQGLDSKKNFETNDHGLTVMLATQKLDEVREEFLLDILSTLNSLDNINEVIIKTHPAESTSYYSTLCSKLQLEITDKVSIHEDNLSDHIQRSDLLFTINSNVGIESMILGTPSVSYNKWQPRIPSYPYATQGPGILLTNLEELQDFIEEIDRTRIEELSNKMEHFASENYKPAENSAKRIAEFIMS